MSRQARIKDPMVLRQIAELPAVLTPDMASKILLCTPQAVRDMCRASKFDCFKVGPSSGSGEGQWRIVTADLIRFCNLYDHLDVVRAVMGRPEGEPEPGYAEGVGLIGAHRRRAAGSRG